MNDPYSVFLIDDEPWALQSLDCTLPWRATGFTVTGRFANARAALDALAARRPDVAFVDIRMPDIPGLEIIERARAENCDTLFVVVSGYDEFRYAQKALRLDVFDYCLKPVDEAEGRALLARVSKRLAAESRPSGALEDVVGAAVISTAPRDSFPPDAECAAEYVNESFLALLTYVNKNYYRRGMNLTQLAKRFHLNLAYCSELFRKVTGMTYTDYVTKLRMEHALRSINGGHVNLQKLALELGYGDYFTFSKRFKQYYGTSPSQL